MPPSNLDDGVKRWQNVNLARVYFLVYTHVALHAFCLALALTL